MGNERLAIMNSIHVNLFLVLRTWKLQDKQNKARKKPFYHFVPGFLLSGKVTEKPQDIAPKHWKGKAVLFSKSIRRKRRWRGPASRSSCLESLECDSGWGLPHAWRQQCAVWAVHTGRSGVWEQESEHRWRVWGGHWRPLTGGAAPSVLLREDHSEWSRGARQVSALRCSHRWSLHVLLWFWVWLYCYPHSSPVFDQALVGTPVVCQPSSSLPADELTYYMRLPWQGDHLPVAIFKIKIRFLKTSSSRYSWKLRPTATMQIRTCPVPQSYQQWAADEPHSLLSAGLSGRRREILKGTLKTFPKAYTFGVIFSSYPEDSKYESG